MYPLLLGVGVFVGLSLYCWWLEDGLPDELIQGESSHPYAHDTAEDGYGLVQDSHTPSGNQGR